MPNHFYNSRLAADLGPLRKNLHTIAWVQALVLPGMSLVRSGSPGGRSSAAASTTRGEL
jgi:hypothetical protein